jgi:hypothetical protein
VRAELAAERLQPRLGKRGLQLGLGDSPLANFARTVCSVERGHGKHVQAHAAHVVVRDDPEQESRRDPFAVQHAGKSERAEVHDRKQQCGDGVNSDRSGACARARTERV